MLVRCQELAKVYLHPLASYMSVLSCVKELLFSDYKESSDMYYLADSEGHPLCSDGLIHTHDISGKTITMHSMDSANLPRNKRETNFIESYAVLC